MRRLAFVLGVGLVGILLASSAVAEATVPAGDASARPLARASLDLAEVAGVQADAAWVPCGGNCYAATVQPTWAKAPAKRWNLTVAGYLWATDIKGTSYADGVATDIDVSFDDLFDKVESSFMGYAEFRYDRFTIALDTSFVSLQEDFVDPASGTLVDANIDQTLIDIRLGYTLLCREVGSAQWGSCCYPRKYTLDAILGARYWRFDQDIDLLLPTGQPSNVSDVSHWWDPYVGVRARWHFAKRWGIGVYADVGGFDIGDASSITWQVQALLRFYVTRGFFVALGYRAIYADRVDGSGLEKNGVDATYQGPMLGLGYTF